MAHKFKIDKQYRARCDKCHHFHSKKLNKPIRCMALFDRKCDQCRKVALTCSVLAGTYSCDKHRDKTCNHCSQKVYRQKTVCKEHLCSYKSTSNCSNINGSYRIRKCTDSSNSYTIYCRHHYIQVNKLCYCGKIPIGWIIIGILYRRKVISHDIFKILLEHIKNHYPYYPCLHKIEKSNN